MNNYIKTKKTVSLINYHFVFCPRYRRKIFSIPEVKEYFQYLSRISCEKIGVDIITMECGEDYVYMFLNCPPTISPSDIINKIKSATSKAIREEFKELSKMPSLWTRNYFVSTESNAYSEIIKKYIQDQKTRS